MTQKHVYQKTVSEVFCLPVTELTSSSVTSADCLVHYNSTATSYHDLLPITTTSGSASSSTHIIFLNYTNAAFVLLACYYFYVAKEVMFYVEFVYSSVCMFATSRKSY